MRDATKQSSDTLEDTPEVGTASRLRSRAPSMAPESAVRAHMYDESSPVSISIASIRARRHVSGEGVRRSIAPSQVKLN